MTAKLWTVAAVGSLLAWTVSILLVSGIHLPQVVGWPLLIAVASCCVVTAPRMAEFIDGRFLSRYGETWKSKIADFLLWLWWIPIAGMVAGAVTSS